ncbi:unnamed protein product [Euphydryas editha]|uniref:Uncharacterized protein n=1 Tax=Euphydryas editha TaxID=104508 RepID=A0AAU9U6R7_EUPED|nr:unnamed protein product [Euphydryas editha]
MSNLLVFGRKPALLILATLLYSSAVNTAPQDSNVTFVKIQPFIDETQNTTLESRVDNASPTNITFENNEPINIVSNNEVTTELEETATEIGDVPTTDEITTIQTTQKTTTTTTTTTRKPKITQSPRFLSKLSNFKKANSLNAVSANAVNSFAISPKDKPYKRKFKSRCRCEKIENCPKLQITVPRCPNDYFLCCF